jgi:hypothetical protein
MAKYGSGSLVIEFDNSGGSLVDMTQYVLEVNGVKISAILEESHTFGDTWFESLATGLSKLDDINIKGFYDDTATTGPNAIWNAIGNTTTRTIKFTWGGSKTTSVETIIMDYARLPKRGELTKFEVTLRPTGTVTEV